MARFKDGESREWVLKINVMQLTHVNDRTGVRLDKLIENNCKGLQELFSDGVMVGQVLWALCEADAAKRGISLEQFCTALAGDSLELATEALLEELADFSPRHQRTVLKALMAKQRTEMDRALTKALKRIDELTSSNSATDSPASSGSIPAG